MTNLNGLAIVFVELIITSIFSFVFAVETFICHFLTKSILLPRWWGCTTRTNFSINITSSSTHLLCEDTLYGGTCILKSAIDWMNTKHFCIKEMNILDFPFIVPFITRLILASMCTYTCVLYKTQVSLLYLRLIKKIGVILDL